MPRRARGRGHQTEPSTYYMHDEFATFRITLIGNLSQHSTAELDQARQTASSILNGRALIVDLTRIDSVDDAGRELIARWHGLGAQFVVTTPEAGARIQPLTKMQIVLLEKKRPYKWLRARILLGSTPRFLRFL